MDASGDAANPTRSGQDLPTAPPETGAADLEAPPCRLCGGSSFQALFVGHDRLLGLPGRFRVVRCENCGLVATNPRPTAAALSRYYPAHYAVYSPDAGQQTRLQLYHARLARRLDRVISTAGRAGSRRVLDLGAGDGAFLAQMIDRGWDVSGLEMDAGAVERARTLRGVDLICGPVETASFPAHSFDLVTLSHVLEHIRDPQAVLQQVRGWLKPGGSLFVTVPNVASWERRLCGEYWYHWDLPRHLTHFSPASLRSLLEREGFRIVETRTLTGLFLLQSLRYLLRRDRPPAAGPVAVSGKHELSASGSVGPSRAANGLREAIKTAVFRTLLSIGSAAGKVLPGEILEVIAF